MLILSLVSRKLENHKLWSQDDKICSQEEIKQRKIYKAKKLVRKVAQNEEKPSKGKFNLGMISTLTIIVKPFENLSLNTNNKHEPSSNSGGLNNEPQSSQSAALNLK